MFYGLSSPGIDNGAHLGGLVAGALCGYLLGPRLVPIRREFGGSRLVDNPIVPYRKIARTFNEYFFGPKDVLGAYKPGWGQEYPRGL